MSRNRPSGQHTSGLMSRRTLLTRLASGVAAVLLPGQALAADDDRTPQFQDALNTLLGDREAAVRDVVLELPDLAENGNMVPFTVSVASPMTDDDHVKTITILSTGNPQPVIARFHLTPANGRAQIMGRLRLARTQDVIAIAELNSGALVSGTANVKVTVGGCGAG